MVRGAEEVPSLADARAQGVLYFVLFNSHSIALNIIDGLPELRLGKGRVLWVAYSASHPDHEHSSIGQEAPRTIVRVGGTISLVRRRGVVL